MHESTFPFFHSLIWQQQQQQLQLFIKYSKFFRRATVDICICKGDFWNIYFLQRATILEYLYP